MKLEGKQINNLVVVGENNTQTATINQAKIGKLQYLLTNGLYSDGIGSTIVEITNNALDSIIQSGKDPMTNPVYVYIEINKNTGKYQLRITDNGLGLNEDEFRDVVMSYLTSTKEDNDDVIGALILGAANW
jgi:HSP90 family molecular chaperone